MVDRVELNTSLNTLERKSKNKHTSSFSEMLKQYLEKVDMEQKRADKMIEEFLSGKRDVHEVVLTLETADVSFRLFMKIREKLIEAYQEIMRMQI